MSQRRHLMGDNGGIPHFIDGAFTVQSLKSRLLYFVVKRQLAALRRQNLPIVEFRLAREAAAAKLFKLPPDVTLESTNIAGCSAEWLRPTKPVSDGVVLYLHGGAYSSGSCITHRAIAARIAAASGHATLIFNYHLAPESPFPAGLDDALAVYQALADVGKTEDKPRLALAGDSAGGGLALALVQRLREQGITMPRALALMSPWTDLALTSETHQTKAGVDPFFPTPERLLVSAKQYAGDTALTHPLVSPHYADLSKLPPMLIHVGTHETLLGESVWLAEKVRQQGGEVELKIWPGMWHVWQAFGGMMREADASIVALGRFLRERFEPASA